MAQAFKYVERDFEQIKIPSVSIEFLMLFYYLGESVARTLFPTYPFIILEAHNPSTDVFKLHKIFSIDGFQGSKIVKESVGFCVIFFVRNFAGEPWTASYLASCMQTRFNVQTIEKGSLCLS